MVELLPKYLKIRFDIVDKIRKGQYRVGDMLPSEEAWAKEYSVSRVTIAKALEALVQNNVIERVQGKGTFLRDADTNIETIHNLQRAMVLRSEKDHSRDHAIIRIEVITADMKIANQLEVSPGSELWRIERYLRGQQGYITIDYSYVPVDYLPREPDFSVLEKTMFHEFMYREAIHKPSYVHVHIDARMPDEFEAKLLEMALDKPVILWETYLLDSEYKSLGLTISIADPKRYQGIINYVIDSSSTEDDTQIFLESIHY